MEKVKEYSTSGQSSIYEQLGIKPIINASGSQTVLGGSILTERVQAAMDAANASFAPMAEVFDKTGVVIAEQLGAEAAFVTSGCFAALVLGTAAIMTAHDQDKISQLPDTTGLRDEFLIQKKLRYHYDKCIAVPGGKLIEVGDDEGTTTAQIEAAIGPKTAGILMLARAEDTPGTLSVSQMAQIAEKAGIALILDAAAEIYPLERMRELPSSGASLVCYGTKYVGSTHSSGILCGKRDYVEAAMLNSFISYELVDSPAYESNIGRGYKIDRQEVIATTVALQEWFDMDHEERLQGEAQKIETIASFLKDVEHVSAKNAWEEEKEPWMRLHLALDTDALGKSSNDIVEELRAGTPSIWTRPVGDSDIFMTVHTLKDGEAEVVGEALRKALK
ncbi:MAG: hypothetical protein AAF702_21090 [Chloroflexota bacterium]